MENRLDEEKDEESIRKTRELVEKKALLDQEIEEFLVSLSVTPSQLDEYVCNPENFSKKNWEELTQIRQELDEKLERDLSNVKNVKKLKNSYQERQVAPHWLFVR